MVTALIVAAALALVGTIAGGITTAVAQKKANEANIQMTRETNESNQALAEKEMAFNSAEAQKAREFELEMSNTSIQRRMADLEASGVNPMLAVGSPAQMASGYAASATTVRNQAPHVEAVTGMGESLAHLASIAQSSAFMMAMSKMNNDRANTYADSRKYVADKNYSARMAQKTTSYFDRNMEYRGAKSTVYK